jgi:cytochrome c peroxidase
MARKSRSTYRRRLIGVVVALVTLTLGGFAIIQAQSVVQTITCVGGFTEEGVVVPPILLTSLSTMPNPVIPKDPLTGKPMVRADLVDYVANLDAAVRLGKALFWDMQAASDNKTACASCHFHGGGDSRIRNQLNPGANGTWDNAGMGPNTELWAGAFPFTSTGGDIDNIVGSQGVPKSNFQGISTTGAELTTSVLDPVYSVNGKNVRQVTGLNAPSVIDAVFNHRNFFNGRAQPEFNGVNPFGNRDLSARVYVVNSLGLPTTIDIHIPNASLASQAVGPILNTVEMSAAGRKFPDVGRKLLRLKPLGLQRLDPTDSVLGPLADPVTGLNTTYTALIKAAFKPKWWNTTRTVTIGASSYSMLEANFSMFWGLSIMMYEATLVSDDTPFDRYVKYRSITGGVPDPSVFDSLVLDLQADYPGLTRANILNGLALFELPPVPAPPINGMNGVGCAACHAGANLTSASVARATVGVEPGDADFKRLGFDLRMERMFLQLPPVPAGTDQITLDPLNWLVTATNRSTGVSAPAPVGVYDSGWYNIGVRPTADDPGLGGTDPFNKPLSWTRLFQTTYTDPSFIKVPGSALGCGATTVVNSLGWPLLAGGLRKSEANDVAGTFKVPSLRNVELRGPYFHNGGKSTLGQVMEFYDEGGDFANPTLAPLIRPLGLNAAQRRDLVAFMLSLTDDRVRWQRAPFDHPQLFVPDGADATGLDSMIELPAVGASGAFIPLRRFMNLNPFEQ